jgi:hypothetical protein
MSVNGLVGQRGLERAKESMAPMPLGMAGTSHPIFTHCYERALAESATP